MKKEKKQFRELSEEDLKNVIGGTSTINRCNGLVGQEYDNCTGAMGEVFYGTGGFEE